MADKGLHSLAEQDQEKLRLTIEGMGRMGDTYAHHNGDLVYVSGGIQGEEVVACVIARRRRYIAAKVIEVVKPSPHRVDAPCAYFGPCTGCQWQHMDYQHQLDLKRQAVEDQIRGIPGLEDFQVSPTIASPQTFHYRNHARFTIGPQGTLGYVNRITRHFISVNTCLLMDPWINGALEKLQGRCQETTQLSVRYGVNTGKGLIQPTLQNLDIPLASGQTHYEESLMGHTFRVAASSFFQVNSAQAEGVVQLLRDRFGLSGRELLVDAYAGVGTFAVLLAPYTRKVIAIEESASAVKDAAVNTLGTENVEFRQGRTEEILEAMEETPDALVLDPPRAGCHPGALEAINRLTPRRICYVSCEPETLARDLGVLCRGSFSLEEVQPVDMFPQTYHVECVATLTSRDQKRMIP